ncbi:Tuftelin-interacting protein 11 [Varanus komodoensis]|uniref:Tuftelin-interacting protein 11 n=1 Tax=Varanus komodoensis TaxID=61221 RepID=A0A8D2LWW0_VARKO|nr:tuftelin-interacting protein 11 [Varanus komodoensis]XP_044296630.1 tuftelin-interacting protein 11 [Varanus komodoensis]KAF7240762.1 Tuftelin-interacting protein 11 [Varanus komodoensis]
MSLSHLYGKNEAVVEDDDVEMEKFEITDWDLQNEFNPNRQRHWQTKEEATYGMWAERDSDDERPSFGGKRSRDYSAPVNFISAGLKKPAGDEITDEDSDEDEKPVKQEEIPKEFVPKKLKTGGNFKPSQKGFVGGARPVTDLGSWERHTKGIGQKLLQKMGYVPGRGLGKNAQGIITPIEAKQRRGKAAIGAYGSERTSQSLQDFPVVDSDEEAEEEFQKELSQWRKDPSGGKKKPKYSYKTVEELKARGRAGKQLSAPQKELAPVKVIDMTGREQKVYYSYSHISQKHNIPDEDSQQGPLGRDAKVQAFALPELEHNLQLLIDLTEQEIIQNDRQLQYERDMVVNLSHEIEKMAEVLAQEEADIRNLGKVLELVEECERRMQPGCEDPLTLPECAKVFQTLQDKYFEEYRMSDRVDLAVAIVFPLVKDYFKNWDPLKDCTYGTEILAKWKGLLENDQLLSHGGQDLASDAFHRLMWETWMPYVRSAVAQWQPRNCIPMADFLDSWGHIIPVWILDNILDQLIFPKLQKEVENWNPLTDTVPIHSWIHPWLPLMQARLEPLYSPIRSKLSNALQKWHPSDSSAKLILQPWKEVFTPGSWEAFMIKNIVPKLGLSLNELMINPHQQHMDAFFWVVDWEGMISVSSLVGLLEKHFFPKWLQVLCSWLSNNPNYEEITKWYLGWKSMFSDQVLAHPSIKEKFNEALDIMNRAVSSSVGGYVQPGARENIAYLTHTERRKDFQYEAMQERREAENMAQRGIGMAAGSVPMNFKDLIQTKAEEHNIVFMPVIGKRHEGKQLYTFGRIVIYIDRGVVFVQGEKTWVPTSLQSLIDMAK